MQRRFLVAVGLTLTLVLGLAMTSCGGDDEPTTRAFSLEIRGGSPLGGATIFEAKQGDTITIDISTNEDAEIHLHGYDIEVEVGADETKTMEILADVTGRFLIEEEATESNLAFLEISPR